VLDAASRHTQGSVQPDLAAQVQRLEMQPLFI